MRARRERLRAPAPCSPPPAPYIPRVPALPSRSLLVAIHDVTPAHETRLAALYRLLEQSGVRRYALLVVPNWHGAWPLQAYASFAAGLRDRAALGATMLLHGLRHDEAGQPRSLAHWARTAGRTAREGEFASLEPAEARARIAQGLEALRAVGLEPVGFVPPAWLARPGLDRLVGDAGLALTEDAHAIYAPGCRVVAPATCWSTRRAWRRAGSVVVAAARLRLERSRPLVRLALHPHDADWPRVLESCRHTLMRLLEQRVTIGYPDLIA
jgi:predicted deacetylase